VDREEQAGRSGEELTCQVSLDVELVSGIS
jgi:hypothetical protein